MSTTNMLRTLMMVGGLVALSGCVAPRLPEPGPELAPAVATRPVVSSEVFVYPSAGQDPSRLDRDRFECNDWAVRQTGFDPAQPRVAPHQRVQVVAMPPAGSDTLVGAATGAIIGAAVSRPREAAGGAIIGAIAGTLLGAASDQSRQQQAEAYSRQMAQRDGGGRAELEMQAGNYRRALTACLEGRGYTVK